MVGVRWRCRVGVAAQCKDANEAANLFLHAADVVQKRLLDKHNIIVAQVQVTKTDNRSGAAGTASDDQALAAIGSDTNPSATLCRWWAAILQESCLCQVSVFLMEHIVYRIMNTKQLQEEGTNQYMLLKTIMAQAQCKLCEIMLTHVSNYGSASNVKGLGIVEEKVLKGVKRQSAQKHGQHEQPKGKLQIHRHEIADKTKRQDVMLPFWGAVASGDVARSMNKS